MTSLEGSTENATLGSLEKESAEEPFVFVSRKKNGRKQGISKDPNLPPQTITAPRVTKDIVQSSNIELPGWTSKKAGKIKKNSQRAKMLGLRGTDQEVKSTEWGLSMIEDRVLTLKQSKFYQAFQELAQLTINPPCKSQEQTLNRKLCLQLSDISQQPSDPSIKLVSERVCCHGSICASHVQENAIKDMIFYGIGSIEASRNSQFQLALGLCLKEILQITGTITISDPIMTEFDKQLAEKLGLKVLEEKDKTSQQVKARTLLYMPHCPKGLYSQVLETNWSRKQLDNLVILGNRFTMYDERQFAKQAPFILPALSIALVSPLPQVKFEDNTIFNDLAIHCFPPDRIIPEVDLADREKDPECL